MNLKIPFYIILTLSLSFLTGTTVKGNPATEAFTSSINNYSKLRKSIYESPNYSPLWGNNEERKAVFALHSEKKLKEFIKASDAWLIKMPIDIQMHYVRSFVFLRLGLYKEYSQSFAIYTGLIASVMSEGDGKSPETAFPVISTKEEYAVLNELGLDLQEQSIDKGCDKMKCKDRDGKIVFIYFNITSILKKYDEKLKPKMENKSQ